MSNFTFADGQLIVNLIESPGRLTAGRCYAVVSSYDGNSGCGAQEWVRIADDLGRIHGFDPDRFVPAGAERSPNPAACIVAMRLRARLTVALKGVPANGPLKDMHDMLNLARGDAEEIIAATADSPVNDQVTFQDVSGGAWDRGMFMDVIVGVDGREVGRMSIKARDDAWSLSLITGFETILEARDYEGATEQTQAYVRQAAGKSALGFWATDIAAKREMETADA